MFSSAAKNRRNSLPLKELDAFDIHSESVMVPYRYYTSVQLRCRHGFNWSQTNCRAVLALLKKGFSIGEKGISPSVFNHDAVGLLVPYLREQRLR